MQSSVLVEENGKKINGERYAAEKPDVDVEFVDSCVRTLPVNAVELVFPFLGPRMKLLEQWLERRRDSGLDQQRAMLH